MNKEASDNSYLYPLLLLGIHPLPDSAPPQAQDH